MSSPEYPTRRGRWVLMLRGLVTVAVLLMGGRAYAGLDCSDKDAEIREVEAFARNKRHGFSHEYVWLCADLAAPRFAARIAAACTTIIARDGADKAGDCVDLAALAGHAALGSVDLFAIVAARAEDPLDYPGGMFWPRVSYLRKMNDPRVAPLLVEQWRATEPRAEARKKRASAMSSWSSWRQVAAAAIGAVGTAEHATFLVEQAKATKDRYVKKACLAAVQAIEARTQQTSPPATPPTPTP